MHCRDDTIQSEMERMASTFQNVPTQQDRVAAITRGFWLKWLSIVWTTIEAIVAVSAGVAAGSLTLTAFGLDSVIELLSAGVLIWRPTVELRRAQEFSERIERLASRMSGGLLFALAAYIVIGAAWSIWTQQGDTFSAPGLVVATLAMPIMVFLARRKLEVAERLGSRAMRADAMEALPAAGCHWSWSSGRSPVSSSMHGGSILSPPLAYYGSSFARRERHGPVIAAATDPPS